MRVLEVRKIGGRLVEEGFAFECESINEYCEKQYLEQEQNPELILRQRINKALRNKNRALNKFPIGRKRNVIRHLFHSMLFKRKPSFKFNEEDLADAIILFEKFKKELKNR